MTTLILVLLCAILLVAALYSACEAGDEEAKYIMGLALLLIGFALGYANRYTPNLDLTTDKDEPVRVTPGVES